ncbi:hypothetical protein AA18895_0775 [Acetobacter ghanensis DSM 18895]|nr:hypothetical protein AA18895_0775 [Acetobacter ghanensis DSM 18895]
MAAGIASHAFNVSSAYRPPYSRVPNSVSFFIVSPVLVFRKTENGRGKFRGERIVIRESRKAVRHDA